MASWFWKLVLCLIFLIIRKSMVNVVTGNVMRIQARCMCKSDILYYYSSERYFTGVGGGWEQASIVLGQKARYVRMSEEAFLCLATDAAT